MKKYKFRAKYLQSIYFFNHLLVSKFVISKCAELNDLSPSSKMKIHHSCKHSNAQRKLRRGKISNKICTEEKQKILSFSRIFSIALFFEQARHFEILLYSSPRLGFYSSLQCFGISPLIACLCSALAWEFNESFYFNHLAA